MSKFIWTVVKSRKTLSELGYARTSLREIARNTSFSLGVIHYYFTDKEALISYCVRDYKSRCVRRYDEIVAAAKTAYDLRKGFAAGMAQTLHDHGAMHRLWYELRTQSFFAKELEKDVAEIDQSLERMIWRIVSEYARLSNADMRFTSTVTFALFDGVFQRGLLSQSQGDPRAVDALRKNVVEALGASIVPRAVAAPARRRSATG